MVNFVLLFYLLLPITPGVLFYLQVCKESSDLSYIVKHVKHPAPIDSLIISDFKVCFCKHILWVSVLAFTLSHAFQFCTVGP